MDHKIATKICTTSAFSNFTEGAEYPILDRVEDKPINGGLRFKTIDDHGTQADLNHIYLK